jgi:hypothetical protein
VDSFDSAWFRGVLSRRCSASFRPGYPEQLVPAVEPARLVARREDWADAPDISASVGLHRELATLRNWVIDERCQIVELSGMGGIGKTTLATRLAKDVAPNFELVYWRSLRFAPSMGDWLTGAIMFLAGGDVQLPDREDECLTLLIRLLHQRRCLLILDNLETLLEPRDTEGRFQDPFDGYRKLLHAMADIQHQSCMILTSREAIAELGLMAAGTVRSLELRGLSVEETRDLLQDKQLTGTELDWADFATRCGGNSLALKITAETVRQLFGGNIGAFLLAVGSNGAIHGGVRQLLASQLEQRLSGVEREVVRLLAISSEPLTPARLLAELGQRAGRGAVIEALEALRRRSLVEPSDSGTGVRLHPVVRDYAAVQLVDPVAA